jgi:hypothetical protein
LTTHDDKGIFYLNDITKICSFLQLAQVIKKEFPDIANASDQAEIIMNP